MARIFFASILRQASAAGLTTTEEVYKVVANETVENLRLMLGGTPAEAFLAEGNERAFGSIRTTAVSALAALGYVGRGGGAPFSVVAWAASDHPRWLFLPYTADQIATLKHLIAAWTRLAIFATMSRREDEDSHTWFVVDELDALGRIDGLSDGMQRVRKFCGRCLLGFQTIERFSEIYGRGTAAAIVENASKRLILRCSTSEDGGTAKFVADLMGQRDVRRKSTNTSGTGSGSSLTIVTEPVVSASEIDALPNLNGNLKQPGRKGQEQTSWARVSSPVDRLRRHTEAFVPRRPTLA